jgi:hypothetical protein
MSLPARGPIVRQIRTYAPDATTGVGLIACIAGDQVDVQVRGGWGLARWREHGKVSYCERSRLDPKFFAVSQKGHWPGCMTFDGNLIAEDPWRCCSARPRI